MVLQVITLVDDASLLVVVIAVVRGTVDHVGDSERRELFSVPSNEIACQEEEPVDDFGAESLVNFVFVLLARRASIVKVFIA